MKNVYNVVLLLILFFSSQKIICQPYLNFRITDFYPVSVNDSNFVESFSNLGRFNLSTENIEEYLTEYIVQYIDIIWDPTESYAVINFEEKENVIFNLLSNQVIDDQILDWHNLVKILYSSTYNNLYVFSEDYSQELPVIISTYNLNTKQIINTTGVSAYAGSKNFLCYPKPDIFFSSDEKYIYISTNDTTTFSTQLWTFSLETNSIINKVNLSEFGYPNMFGYSMSFGSRGKGIICSYNEYNASVRHLYYNIYDFDNNTSTGFIHKNNVDNEYYFTNNGKYLLFISSVWGDTSNPHHHTGYTEIYNAENGQLLKNINLPPNGIIYTFDNYPNNIYYVIDIEKPTRQIYALKMDSIFNVLDLTSLNPSTKTVNSPPFTLTVNGHGFDTLSTVYFNGNAKTTTYVNDSVLTTEISTLDISVAGNYPVWVTDEWGTSDTLMFSVTTAPPVVSIMMPSMSFPYSSEKTQPLFTCQLRGNNFTEESAVYYNGSVKTTEYKSDTLLTFSVNSDDIQNTGNYPVYVNNQGINSDTILFRVILASSLPQAITPILECVRMNSSNSYTAYYGYNNNNKAGIFIPVGKDNYIETGQLGLTGLPVNIFLPGRQTNVFSIGFNGTEIKWKLLGLSVSASRKSPACP